jgi:hypothetical protein
MFRFGGRTIDGSLSDGAPLELWSSLSGLKDTRSLDFCLAVPGRRTTGPVSIRHGQLGSHYGFGVRAFA